MKTFITLITLDGNVAEIEIDSENEEAMTEYIKNCMKSNDWININMYGGSCEYIGCNITDIHPSKIIAIA